MNHAGPNPNLGNGHMHHHPGNVPGPMPGVHPGPHPFSNGMMAHPDAPPLPEGMMGYPDENQNGPWLGFGLPGEPKEPSSNYTWVVDRTEVHLGWTGNWDKYSEIRQHSIGVTVAGKLLKLFQQMEKNSEKAPLPLPLLFTGGVLPA